jgi:chromosome segregation ATPase
LADNKVQQDIIRFFNNQEKIQAAVIAISLAKEEYEEDNKYLNEAEKKLRKAKAEVASLKEAVKKMRKARRHPEMSMYTQIEEVLKRYGISKESYHGGQFKEIQPWMTLS